MEEWKEGGQRGKGVSDRKVKRGKKKGKDGQRRRGEGKREKGGTVRKSSAWKMTSADLALLPETDARREVVAGVRAGEGRRWRRCMCL